MTLVNPFVHVQEINPTAYTP